MAKVDLRSNQQAVLGISDTLSGTTASKGNICDLQGFEGATLFLATGIVTDAGTASGFSFEVQESDDTADTNFTAVADADLIGTEAALTVTSDDADEELIGSIGYRGSKRYIRVVATGTTNTAAVVAGVWVKGAPVSAKVDPTAADIAAT